MLSGLRLLSGHGAAVLRKQRQVLQAERRAVQHQRRLLQWTLRRRDLLWLPGRLLRPEHRLLCLQLQLREQLRHHWRGVRLQIERPVLFEYRRLLQRDMLADRHVQLIRGASRHARHVGSTPPTGPAPRRRRRCRSIGRRAAPPSGAPGARCPSRCPCRRRGSASRLYPRPFRRSISARRRWISACAASFSPRSTSRRVSAR